MKKGKKRKLIAFMLLVLTLFMSVNNLVYAVTEISKANLTTIQDSDSQIQFKYDSGWTNVRTNYVGYRENGKVYPAYCISHGLPGVDELGDYTVSIEKTLDDVRLWRTIINGFPYKSPSQLGVENEIDAYVATKQAIYCVILNRDVYSLYRGRTARGDKIVNAIYNLTNIGLNGTQTPEQAQLKIYKSGDVYEQGNYYVQKFNVSSAVDIASYTITSSTIPSGAIITDSAGNSKTTFSNGESCYLKIPQSSMSSDINATINIQGKCKTYPVFFGETPIAGAQNYAVTFDPYGDDIARATFNIKTNTGKVRVTKLDSENKTAIKGVTFQLLKADGTQVATATTNENGIATFSNLYQGNYKLREISTLNTYILNSEVFDISVNYNGTTEKTVTNVHKKGNIEINKTDSETSEPIADVTFQLIDSNGNVVQTGTTNKNGELTFNNIRVGNYKLKEVKTNINYVLNTTVFDVKVEHEKTTVKNITNDFKKGNLKINKTDAETSKGIQGVTFELQKKDGTVVATATTNEKGEAFFNNIRIGNYNLKEVKTNSNYILNTTNFEVNIEYNKTVVKDITNEHKRGNISILKVDKDNNRIALGNVIFDLFSYEFNKVVGTYVTDVDGQININNLRIGKYSLIEKNTGKWYNLADSTDVKIEWNKTTNTTIENELKKGKIKVTKVDLDNNEIKIPNVTFEVLDKNGKVLEEITTNESGIAETSRFAIRDYETLTLKETKTDKWYVLNDKEIDVKLKENQVVDITLENELKKGQIKVIKVDLDNNEVKLKGVEFKVLDESGKIVDTLITDENGEAVSKRLPINQKYTLKETKTLEEYVLNQEIKTVTLEHDKITDVTFTNELKKGQIRVIKIDLDNNEVKLKGVEFNVLDESGEIVDTLITDENGEAVSKRLPINQKYKLKETKTLENYVLNEETQTVILEQDKIKDITFTNELKKGQVRVIKVDLYNNEVRLKGVEFELLDESGNVIDTLITDQNGEAVSKLLRIDRNYTLKETKTLEKYDLNQETQTVILEQDKIKDITFTNELKKGQIRVIKIDLDNNEVKLKGVEFNVLDESGEIVDTLITDENGEAISKELRVNQKYTLKETKTLENYVLNEEMQTVTLKPAEITSVTFENEKIKGYIQVTKTSSEDNEYSKLPKGSPLSDVTFEIYDSENNKVDTITTDSAGTAVSKELLKGCYTVKEISSAKYYLLNTNIYNAEIVNDQEIVNVNITNDSVDIDVEINKKGFIETQSKDNIYYTFSNIQNKSNVELDNFTWEDNLPTEALRIDKIYTGTWSQDLEYAVYYKTNLSDEYVLFKDNLNTKKVYELDFNSIELKENEYITSYQFRFGTVEIGFKEVESPILYCNMLDKLPNGFVFTNKTKVSGTYFEAYVEDNDEWTTITYKKEIELNKTLPRTRILK